MKKMLSAVLIVALVMVICGCSAKEPGQGVSPYEMSDKEKALLSSLGLENDVCIINFKTPENARSLDVRAWILEDGEWVSSGGVGLSGWNDAGSEGTLSILLEDRHVIRLNVNMKGRSSFKTEEIEREMEISASAIGFLTEFREIEVNNEIPVAIMIYSSSTRMKDYSIDSYFEPSVFEETEMVQAVTIKFSDEE